MSEPTVPGTLRRADGSRRAAEQRMASGPLRRRFAKRLAALRRRRGWTQRQLAKYCGCHTNFISNLEQGTVNATLATLEMLARACESDLLAPAARQPTPTAPVPIRCDAVASRASE